MSSAQRPSAFRNLPTTLSSTLSSAVRPGKSLPYKTLYASMLLLTMTPFAMAQTADAANTDVPTTDTAALQTMPANTETSAPSAVFDTMTIISSADASAQGLAPTYEGGQVATGSRVGLLGTQDIMRTPFSITAYTNEFIENQQAQSVGDLLKKDPTVRVARGFGNFQEAYFMRGFVTTSDDTMYNGLYGILPRQYIATELFERVEVQRGASAMLNGSAPSGGNAGGTINLLPKRAGNEPMRQLTVGYGEGNQGKVAVDVSDRFGADDAIGMRFNAAYHDGDTAIDDESAKLGLAALGMDYRGEDYRLSADLGWQDNKLEQTRTNVSLDGASRVPKAPDAKSNWAQPWTYSNEEDRFATVRGEYDINDAMTAYGAYGIRQGKEGNSLANLSVSNVDGTGSAYRFDNSREDLVQSAELGLRGTFNTAAIAHDWVLSANRYDQEEKGAYAFDPSNQLPTSLYRPTDHDNAWSDSAIFGGNLDDPKRSADTQLQSFALADTLSFMDDKVHATLGVRHQNIQNASYDYNTQAQTSDYDESAWTPSLGLVYQPSADWSLYGNYIESLAKGEKAPLTTPTGDAVTNAGQNLKPYVSKQAEVGVKYDNGTIGSSLALFRTEAPRAYVDDSNTFSDGGENLHQGAELSVFGSPSENMRLIAGVTYLNAKQTDTGEASLNGNRVIGTPTLQSNVNLEYDVAAVSGLTLTGDVIHTGARYADMANTLKVDGYTTLDLGARYKTKFADQDVTLKGVVTNVTGEDYWQSVGGLAGYGYLNAGEPTAVKVSATFDF